MAWTYSYHIFTNAAAFNAARKQWPTNIAVFDVIGIIYDQGAEIDKDEFGQPIYEQLAQDGWHVNAAWRDIKVPANFGTRIYPSTPARVWMS